MSSLEFVSPPAADSADPPKAEINTEQIWTKTTITSAKYPNREAEAIDEMSLEYIVYRLQTLEAQLTIEKQERKKADDMLALKIAKQRAILIDTGSLMKDMAKEETTINIAENCLICKKVSSDVTFEPCNHTITCIVCAMEVMRSASHECPIDGRLITGYTRTDS